MTFKEETPMALGQALKGTSQAPEGPSSHPAVRDTPGFPMVRSARPLEFSGDHERGFLSSLQVGTGWRREGGFSSRCRNPE